MTKNEACFKCFTAGLVLAILLHLACGNEASAMGTMREFKRGHFSISIPDNVVVKELSNNTIEIRLLTRPDLVQIVISEIGQVKFPLESGDYSMEKAEFLSPAVKQVTYWKDSKLRGKELLVKGADVDNIWIHAWIPITDADTAGCADKILSTLKVQ